MPIDKSANRVASNESPLVSVLCPVYNAEKFIESTLLSIVKQDYENIEVVVSDDCSTDGTVSVISKMAEQFPEKIIVNLNKSNLGITRNCNKALALCGGKYVSFFAGDDLMYPGKISAQVLAMESDSDCSLSYHPVDVLDGENDNCLLFTTEKDKQSYRSFVDVIARGGVIGACSIMARLDAIPPYGFSASFPSVSDWLMHIEVALRGKIIKVDGVYAGYLRHSKGASRKTFETLGEVRGTLTFLRNRYPGSEAIVSITRKAYRRYILGELARLFIAGDDQRLGELSRQYMHNMLGCKVVAFIMKLMIYLRINNASLTRRVFDFFALRAK